METFSLTERRPSLCITNRKEAEKGMKRDRKSRDCFRECFSMDRYIAIGPTLLSRFGERDRSSPLGAARSGEDRTREEMVEEEAYVMLVKTHTVTRSSYDIMLCKT